MKRIVHFSVFIFCLLLFTPVQAQFFKKLGDRISDAAEKTILNKTEKKTQKTVSKSIDDLFTFPGQKKGKGKKADKPRHDYHFSYLYQVQIKSGHGSKSMETQVNYYLNPGAGYTGMAVNKSGVNVFMVFDHQKSTIYNFITSKGQKMVTSVSLKNALPSSSNEEAYQAQNYTITELPSKNILGYTCTGKQMENKEWKYIIYYTTEIDIDMGQIFNSYKNLKNKKLKNNIPIDSNGVMMYMKVFDKKKGDTFVMECTKLEETQVTLNTTQYKYMMF